MYRLLILLSFLTYLGCAINEHKTQNFDEIQVSYSDGWHKSLSLKIIGKSRIFIRDNISGKKTHGELNHFKKATLDSFFSEVKIFSLDSVYKPVGYSVNDCGSFRIYVRKGTLNKIVYSDCIAPQLLKGFKNWIIELGKTYEATLDSTVDYTQTDEGYR